MAVLTRNPERQPKYHDFAEAARELRALCDERASAYSGLSVGVLLSGGIDSSAVAASLRNHAKRVVGYHWDFRGVIDGDETKFALTAAEKLGIDIKLISVKSIIEKGNYFDLDYVPSYAPYSHNFLKLQEETTKRATSDVEVLTTGHLGDDLFGGVNVGPAHMFIDLLRHFSLRSIWWILGIPSLYRSNVSQVGDRLFGSNFLLTPRAQLVAEDHVEKLGSRRLQMIQLSTSEDRDIAIETGLMNRNGLSLRHFYQYGDFIDLSARLPASFKTLPFYGVHFRKALLRYAFRNDLPASITNRAWRPPYSRFSYAYIAAHDTQVRDLLGGASRLAQEGIINGKAFEQPMKNISVAYNTILVMAMTEIWLRRHPHVQIAR